MVGGVGAPRPEASPWLKLYGALPRRKEEWLLWALDELSSLALGHPAL